MSDMPINSAGASGGEDVVRALRFLARRAASSGVSAVSRDGGLELSILCESGTVTAVSVSAVTWLLLRTKAWVTAHDGNRCENLWRLTARGRQQARRQLSAQGEAAPIKSNKAPPARLATPERPTMNLDESPIAWLARRRDKRGQPMISGEQLAAAERLRADFWFAGMSPRVTTNWSAAATGGVSGGSNSRAEMSDNVMAAATRVRHAITAVGPELASVLIDVCCHLNGLEDAERKAGWPLRSAKVVLQLALTRLARHYGLLAPASMPQSSRSPVRHWGAAGYRPATNMHSKTGSDAS